MDKLKPLIQHHFWILFVLVLILPIIGWMPATGQFSQQTATKLTQINEAFTKIPNGQHANKTWGEQLDNKVKQAERKNRDARRQLWERQEKMMVWPNTIRRDLQPKTYLQEISPIARNIYKNNYDIEVRKVWQKINPFDYETGKGTVLYKLEQMPRQQFGDLTPTSQELWDAQEDLWLLSSLFDSIRRANSDATVLTESLVRSIKTLYLVGGTGEYPQAESTGGMDGMGGMGAEFSAEMGDPGMMGDAGGFGMDNRRPVTAGSLSFNPADEFGMEQGRYVDYKPDTIFKKRGFYMEAIIDHQRLPELLATLSNGAWPVTITRVQMAQVGFTGGGMGASGGAGLGMGGGAFGGPGAGGGLLGRPSMGRPSFGGSSRRPGAFAGDDMMAGDMMDAGGFPGQPGTNINTEHASMAAAAEVGPQLAMVAISGVIYFYNPPGLEGESVETSSPATSPTPEAAVPATESPASELPASPPVPADGEAPNAAPADAATPDPEAPASETAAPAAETPAAAPAVE